MDFITSLKRFWVAPIATFLLIFSFPFLSDAQVAEKVYSIPDYKIDPAKEKQLFLEFDNLNFFKDDEYSTKMMKGYTLPGFWIQAKAVYYPLANLKVEAGIHSLWYWGATRYPDATYQDIPLWNGREESSQVHLFPWLRAQLSLNEHFDLVFGNIYGGTNHRLITPLYNTELAMTADPEAGLQLLFDSERFDLDLWVNWQSFIYKSDTHQEVFTVGLSSRLKLNDPASPFHLYVPLQVLAQHHGGEIDTITVHSVQTIMNGAVGVGGVWNVNRGALSRVNASVNLVGYYQQAGEMYPVDHGHGLYVDLSADVQDFRFKAAYWQAHDYYPILASPLYGVSTYEATDLLMYNPKTVSFGIEYARTLGRGCSFGADVDCYNHFSGEKYNMEGERFSAKSEFSFSFGAYLRFNPSVLLKSFK